MDKNLVPQVFNHEEFGEFRVFKIDEVPWAVAADVAKILGIENVRQNLSEFPDDEKMTVSNTYGHSGKRGGAQFLNLVNEAGLYRLIFQSRKPEAEKFKHWVFHDVLPTLRKTGEYKMNGEKSDGTLRFAMYEGTDEGEFGKIPRLEVNGKLVLTTAQLAKFYECSAQSIRKIFARNEGKFIEGEHYLKLEGSDLRDFKRYSTESTLATKHTLPVVNPFAPHLALWTVLGAASFAKSLRTKKAWEVYEQLALNYFSGKKITGKKSGEKISKDGLSVREKIKFLLQAAKITKDAARRENLIATAETIINSI